MEIATQAGMSFRLPYSMKEEGGWIIASCDVLDVHSQGKTEEEALADLREATQLFLETCLEMDTLDQVIKSCRFRLAGAGTQEPVPEVPMMEVPVYLLSGKDAQNHAH